MGSFAACYLRSGPGEFRAVAAEVKRALRPRRDLVGRPIVARFRSGFAWLQIQPANYEDLHEVGQYLSKELGREAVVIEMQSVVDFFGYSRWSAGQLVRKLVYGSAEEGTWSTVAGQAESWESSILFHAGNLDQFACRAGLSEAARAVYRALELQAGALYPSVGVSSAVPSLASILGLPGFEASPLSAGSAYWSFEKAILWPSFRDIRDAWRLYRSAFTSE